VEDGVTAYPAWSPDGSRVAFSASGTDDTWAIHVLDESGTQTRLTPEGMYAIAPSWSPDGRRIAFSARIQVQRTYWDVHSETWMTWNDTDEEIFVMDADGRNVVRVTDNEWSPDAFPAWSPDGKRIAYASYNERSSGGSISSTLTGRTALGLRPLVT
jgi:Tol biopolymer transport system component